MTSQLIVPYVVAWSGEAVEQDLVFEDHAASGGLRLTYRRPRPRTDWRQGVLLARVRTNRRGEPLWRMLNRRRQWECMVKNLCQVCGRSAVDGATGRIWWVITETAFRATATHGDLTNAPPTCARCIPDALALCPQLRKSASVCTVEASESAGVLADLFLAGPSRRPIHQEHNLFVGWDEFAKLPRALATQMVARLHGVVPAEHPELAGVMASPR